MISNSVSFSTNDKLVNAIYRSAEEKEKNNVINFNGKRAVVEGGEYRNLWLETQPMGGEMYAKRDLEAGYNNIELFMDAQNEEGMMPGMLSFIDGVYREHHNFIQGFCFPIHALNMYYLIGEDRKYLKKVYNVLERNDKWFWENRESDGDGCLEAWCPCDTGEDYSQKFFGAPHFWEEKTPPCSAEYHFPRESMDMMAYSYDARNTLSAISEILCNGKKEYWANKALEVKKKLRSYLWREEKNACYDRDENNDFLEILVHNNIRCMYHGVFDQKMADAFIQNHLFNENEFWTPMPLPSIAVNDPCFRNIPENNWSGQPEGLTYQRTIRALENYGHYAELTLIAKKLFEAVGEDGFFTQQFDTFTKAPSTVNNPGDYGPTLLSCLEYISRLYGVHKQLDTIYWGAYSENGKQYTYTQKYGDREYKIINDSFCATAYVDGNKVFEVSTGYRVETDTEGKVKRVINIQDKDSELYFKSDFCEIRQLTSPNNVVGFNGYMTFIDKSVSYCTPHK